MPRSGFRDHATGKALEGADRQTNRQTNRLSVHYSKMQLSHVDSGVIQDKYRQTIMIIGPRLKNQLSFAIVSINIIV